MMETLAPANTSVVNVKYDTASVVAHVVERVNSCTVLY